MLLIKLSTPPFVLTPIFLKKLFHDVGQSPLKKALVFYEDGQLHTVNEYGVEPVSLVDEEMFAIEIISFRTQFLKNKPPERPSNFTIHLATDERNSEDVNTVLCNRRRYTAYSDGEKTVFLHLFFFSKSLSTSAAAKQSGTHIHAVQR